MATNSQHSTGRSKREMRARSMKTCARQAAAVSTVGAWRPEAHRIAQPSRYVFEYTSAFVVNRENLSLFLRPFGRKKISGVIDRVGDACVTEFSRNLVDSPESSDNRERTRNIVSVSSHT